MKLIPLSKGLFAQVDDEDFEEVNKHKWTATKSRNTFYAMRLTQRDENGKRENIQLHRLIMGCKRNDGKVIDHINKNGLDCQRNNLRFCTNAENSWNTKNYKGISKYKGVTIQRGKWKVKLRVNKKDICLSGYFKSEENAATAYNILAEKHHGQFANLNR